MFISGINYIYQLKLKHHQATQILSCICKELAKLNSTQHLQSLVMPSMFQATESGNLEFVTEMIRFDPALLWSRTELGGIFHSAVAQRQEKIWNLIYETEDKRDVASIEDNFDNNILHIAGMLASVSSVTKIPGPAMQMQRELQWFKVPNLIMLNSHYLITALLTCLSVTGSREISAAHVERTAKQRRENTTSIVQ